MLWGWFNNLYETIQWSAFIFNGTIAYIHKFFGLWNVLALNLNNRHLLKFVFYSDVSYSDSDYIFYFFSRDDSSKSSSIKIIEIRNRLKATTMTIKKKTMTVWLNFYRFGRLFMPLVICHFGRFLQFVQTPFKGGLELVNTIFRTSFELKLRNLEFVND